MFIQKIFLAIFEIIPVSDWDSFSYIWLKTPGENLVWMFRKSFNMTYRKAITGYIEKILNENPLISKFDLKAITENAKKQHDIEKMLN